MNERSSEMPAHTTFYLRVDNAPAVLTRILLVFSRRRLRIQGLRFLHVDEARPAELQIDLDCEARVRRDVAHQLERIVEVLQVTVEVVEARAAPAPVGAPAAA